jgi:DNA-binding MarR family transcriptional regulator
MSAMSEHPPAPSPSAAALDLVARLATASGALDRAIDRPLSGSHGLGLNDLRLLLALEAAPGRRLSRVELAEQLGISASGVTRQLGPLERIGLVGRERHATDARLALAVLTEGGDQVARDAAATAAEAAEAALDRRWSSDEQAALRALLAG